MHLTNKLKQNIIVGQTVLKLLLWNFTSWHNVQKDTFHWSNSQKCKLYLAGITELGQYFDYNPKQSCLSIINMTTFRHSNSGLKMA